MGKNNLAIIDTGLDHIYLNGIPIVEAEIDISDVFKKVSRISSLAVLSDPYFNDKSSAQKLFSELHGNGDRITMDFLEEGAKDILPMFIPFQRLMPEGTYGTTPVNYKIIDQSDTYNWSNPDPTDIYINSINVSIKEGSATLAIYANGGLIDQQTLPDTSTYSMDVNLRDEKVSTLQVLVSGATDLVYDISIVGMKLDAIDWIKAVKTSGELALPSINDDIKMSYLIQESEWNTINPLLKVNGVVLERNSGSAYVTINYNGIAGTEKFLELNTVGEDYSSISDIITTITVELRDATDDFNYNLIINTEIPDVVPSPRFEFNSDWNSGKIIYRYQNMDSRTSSQKLNYTSETLRNIRIDTNTFNEVLKYVTDSLKNYVMKELYEAIGYDKKAVEYKRKYEMSRSYAKFWLGSEKGLQTQYNY